jgi:hypothetical protein
MGENCCETGGNFVAKLWESCFVGKLLQKIALRGKMLQKRNFSQDFLFCC